MRGAPLPARRRTITLPALGALALRATQASGSAVGAGLWRHRGGPLSALDCADGGGDAIGLIQTSADVLDREVQLQAEDEDDAELSAWPSQDPALVTYSFEMRALVNWLSSAADPSALQRGSGGVATLLQLTPTVKVAGSHRICSGREAGCMQDGHPAMPVTADSIISAALAGALMMFVLASTGDFRQFSRLHLRAKEEQCRVAARKGGQAATVKDRRAATPPARSKREVRSMAAIMGLTFYRFYTGFLSATWLPYLLAMEGEDLWGENQALFMGIVKLLYGASILLNPLFGLLGDQAAAMSHGLGRRLFVRMGIILAALGIFTCHFAAPRGLFKTFLLGIVVWRLGEGLNDVTTEAICPEMLPPEQFQISSSIRAAMFLVGGLVGYMAVMAFAHLHYSWLYHGYLVMMLLCGLPALALISDAEPSQPASPVQAARPLLVSAADAYLRPALHAGGFPVACLCIFLFSCGSAPMFFLLLMLRDLVGIKDSISLQMHFSLVSIDFFLSAAAASALNVMFAPSKGQQAPDGQPGLRAAEAVEKRRRSFQMTAASVFAFGVVVVLIPFMHFLPTVDARRQCFYVLSALMGATFGSVYSRFQDCNWQLLPPKVETANAMGFSTMCKLLGAGLGNFGAGLILDLFQTHRRMPHISLNVSKGHVDHAAVAYSPVGYLVLCVCCALLVCMAGGLVLTIPARVAEEARQKDVEQPQVTGVVPAG